MSTEPKPKAPLLEGEEEYAICFCNNPNPNHEGDCYCDCGTRWRLTHLQVREMKKT